MAVSSHFPSSSEIVVKVFEYLSMLFSKHNPANLQTTTFAHLGESGLILQNLLGLLETIYLGLTAGSAFLVCLKLGNATVLDLAIILHDSSKLLEVPLSDARSVISASSPPC